MSDGNLLAFGCAVSFIAIGGAYVYLRERWMENAPTRDTRKQLEKVASEDFRDVA